MANRRVTLRPRVMTAQDVKIDPGQAEDTYLGKVSRYIPAEIVAAYIAARGLYGTGARPAHAEEETP